MIRALRRRLGSRPSDAGLTLTELVVAASISLLVLTMVGAMLIQTANLTANAVQNRNSTTVASTAIAAISKSIRLATTVQMQVSGKGAVQPAVVSGTATTLTVYSYVDTDAANPVPSRVTFDGTGTELKETRCVGTQVSGFWSFSACTPTVRNLGGSIIAPAVGEDPLFVYRGADGTVIPLVSGSLPPASLPSVASVLVSMKIQAVDSKTGPAYLTSDVGMPNIGLTQGTAS
jgi:hypothetical protein